MFESKFRDEDPGHVELPGHFIWKLIELIAYSQAAVHRRFNEIPENTNHRNFEVAVGRTCAHWPDLIINYERTGYIGFCTKCTSEHCIINRQHCCRIRACYNLTIQLFEHYGDNFYVTDLGIPRSDIEIFITYFIRQRPGMSRFARLSPITLPGYEDKSDFIYNGETMDLAKLSRPI